MADGFREVSVHYGREGVAVGAISLWLFTWCRPGSREHRPEPGMIIVFEDLLSLGNLLLLARFHLLKIP